MEVMEDHQAQAQTTTQSQTQIQSSTSSPRNQCTLERNEPVRSRWTPKPEQILILESIFNSGMVNPPKEETVKIRKLLEKFGSVGDANVFYWFQNRRSRSRRRQRQIQASLINSGSLDQHQQQQSPMLARCGGGGVTDQYQAVYTATTTSPELIMQQPPSGFFPMLQSLSPVAGSSSSSSPPPSRIDGGVEYPFSGQSLTFPEFEHNTSMPSSSLLHLDTSKVHYEFGFITVFINGVPTEVESGPLNIKSMFNEEVMLVHSSGVPVPLDDYGISMPGLQHGESYFLVSRPS
uniref:WUSCHEL-related homeobox 11-like n=1 Tax=Erigeron canadensis TaxID=72917 RepID=UPI001CB959E8|nr:WUSCHEL-related homeobox 11-like [Erigeron canadensis]